MTHTGGRLPARGHPGQTAFRRSVFLGNPSLTGNFNPNLYKQ